MVGDIHGAHDALCARLLGPDLRWDGGTAHLWLLGDLVDRGADDLAVIELVMRLQHEAASSGGMVAALLGNHELHLLAARRFGERDAPELGCTFEEYWLRGGGQPASMLGLTIDQATWLAGLPALALDVMHADAPFYGECGDTIPAVNAAFRAVIGSDDAEAWALLLRRFAGRLAFDPRIAGRWRTPQWFLDRFGTTSLVQGPPIDSSWTSGPFIYWKGRCVALDGRLWAGEPGCLFRIA